MPLEAAGSEICPLAVAVAGHIPEVVAVVGQEMVLAHIAAAAVGVVESRIVIVVEAAAVVAAAPVVGRIHSDGMIVDAAVVAGTRSAVVVDIAAEAAAVVVAQAYTQGSTVAAEAAEAAVVVRIVPDHTDSTKVSAVEATAQDQLDRESAAMRHNPTPAAAAGRIDRLRMPASRIAVVGAAALSVEAVLRTIDTDEDQTVPTAAIASVQQPFAEPAAVHIASYTLPPSSHGPLHRSRPARFRYSEVQDYLVQQWG